MPCELPFCILTYVQCLMRYLSESFRDYVFVTVFTSCVCMYDVNLIRQITLSFFNGTQHVVDWKWSRFGSLLTARTAGARMRRRRCFVFLISFVLRLLFFVYSSLTYRNRASETLASHACHITLFIN